ncbi:MAG: hypothetical protein ACR2NX_05000 [Chthoniobacterales bacterium]
MTIFQRRGRAFQIILLFALTSLSCISARAQTPPQPRTGSPEREAILDLIHSARERDLRPQ